MIKDGVVVHQARTASFRELEFESEAVNIILLAVLTTLLSYQLSGIFYNIFLGSKAKGRATASDIHKLILTESASPLSIFAAVARIDILDRLRFQGDLPRNVRIARRDTSVSPGVVISLILLLLFAPLFNLISIFIVLQRDEILTFSEARFGGLALCVGDSTITFQEFTPFCDRIPLEIEGPGTSLAQFHICLDFEVEISNVTASEKVRLVAETTFQGQMKVSVINLPSNTPFSTAVLLDLTTEGTILRTKPVLSQSDAARLIHDGQDRLALYCDSATKEKSPQDEELIDFEGGSTGLMKGKKDFNCSLPNATAFIDVVFNMTERINVFEKEEVLVTGVTGLSENMDSLPAYDDAGEFRFIIRRTRIVNLLMLFVLVVAALFVRLLTEIVFNNDLDEGLEAVVRYRLGVDPREALLKSTRKVRYNSKAQSGSTAHYGVQRQSLPEVMQFDGGTEIGMEENTNLLRSRDQW